MAYFWVSFDICAYLVAAQPPCATGRIRRRRPVGEQDKGVSEGGVFVGLGAQSEGLAFREKHTI